MSMEEVFENVLSVFEGKPGVTVREVESREAGFTSAAATFVKPRLAKLVIGLSLFLILEYLIRLSNVLKLFGCNIFVVRVLVLKNKRDLLTGCHITACFR
jgi:hypothetical protein